MRGAGGKEHHADRLRRWAKADRRAAREAARRQARKELIDLILWVVGGALVFLLMLRLVVAGRAVDHVDPIDQAAEASR